jgi:hypothetical protein
MKAKHLAALCGLALGLQGCAAAGLAVAGAGAGVGMGAGVEHTMNGIAYKTFTAPVNNVRFATLKSLDRMGMPVSSDEKADSGWRLVATANERSIEIELERLTDQVTRMRVVANKGDIFFKDSSTATEIILQTAQALQDEPAATKAASEKNGKRRTS